MSRQSKYNIPEFATPRPGVITREEARFYFGDYSDGFEFPAKKVKPHRHPYFEIFWFPEPSGAFMADFKTFPLEEPSLVFVSPGQVHGWPGGHELKGCMLAFDEAFLHESDKAFLHSPLFYDADSSPVVPVTNVANNSLLWKQFAEEFGHPLADQAAALQALLRLLLISAHRMADATGAAGTETLSSGVRLYQSFIRLLSGDLPEDHLLKDYARHLQVSPDYLSECVRKNSGHKAGELIRRRIALESKRLLAHSDLTIAEVAYHLHFKDPSYFSRFVKQNTGRTPKEFRDDALRF